MEVKRCVKRGKWKMQKKENDQMMTHFGSKHHISTHKPPKSNKKRDPTPRIELGT